MYTIRISKHQRHLIMEALQLQLTPGEADEKLRLWHILNKLDGNEKANRGSVHIFGLNEGDL